jgi:hypothetical protein
MKALSLLAALALLTASAFAQADMHCFKTDQYTTACESSDGRVHLVTIIGDESWSHWYTAPQWKAKRARDLAKQAREDRAKAKKHDDWQSQNERLEAKAQTIKAQPECEGQGFMWVTKGELQPNNEVKYAGACHHSEAAMEVFKNKGTPK